jgi:hypothetical protein
MPDEQNDQDDISKLLRLKRFEQPPPEYFETFLQEFKDRQRGELLRERAWKIGWDRLCAFFGEQMPARIGYGMATAAVLVTAAIASVDILESRPIEVVASAPAQQDVPEQTDALTLNTQAQTLPDLPTVAPTTSFIGTRYVMDARPASYEKRSSF